MARYRVGNKYLSEKEYAEEADSNWSIGLFLFGFIFITVGWLMYWLLYAGDLPKAFKFIITAVSAIAGGSILVYFRNLIQAVLGFVAVTLILVGIGSVIWQALPEKKDIIDAKKAAQKEKIRVPASKIKAGP